MMFYTMLTLSTLSVMTANSWLTIWLALEINLMSFIPIMSNKSPHSSETSIKYFLVQALASSMLIMIIMNMAQKNTIQLLIIMPVMMKLGASPLHFWFTNVMEGLSWKNSLILMTWQKMAPLSLMPIYPMKTMILMASTMSIMTGSLGGVNQTSIRKLLTFSSINHLGWMMITSSLNESIWIKYMLTYTILITSIITMMNKTMFNIKQTFNKYSPLHSTILSMNFLSMMGIPPLMGFFPKWISIQLMVNTNNLILATLMVMMSLPMTFFYLYLMYHNMSIYSISNPWKNKKKKTNMMLTTMALTSLPVLSYLMM